MLPVLLVGIRRPADVEDDFGDSVSARRLERLLSVRRGCLREALDAVNLLGPSDEESPTRLEAAASLVDVDGREALILCGVPVHRAFGFRDLPTCESGRTERYRRVRTLLLPHPSGRNRDWNDAGLAAAVAAVLREHISPHLPPETLEPGTEEASVAAAAATRAGAWREAVLESIAHLGSASGAAKVGGVSQRTIARHAKQDPEFAERLDDAWAAFKERALAEIARRGIHGVRRMTTVAGEAVEQLEYSDAILLRIVERLDPEWSPRRRQQLSGPQGEALRGPVILPLLDPEPEPTGGE